MPFCVDRWLGGTLTNYETVKRSIAKFKKYQQMETSGEMSKLPRKEESAIKRAMGRMQRNFNGIVDMGGLPSALFVVDINHEKIAVAEADRCGIPCIALVDTNSDPGTVTHPIPGNDDAVKSIRIIVETIAAAVQSGLSQREAHRAQRGAADLKAAQAAEAPRSRAGRDRRRETGEDRDSRRGRRGPVETEAEAAKRKSSDPPQGGRQS